LTDLDGIRWASGGVRHVMCRTFRAATGPGEVVMVIAEMVD
jgi:hypothetical protein